MKQIATILGGVWCGLQAWASQEHLDFILPRPVGEDGLHQWKEHCLVHPACNIEGGDTKGWSQMGGAGHF